VTLVIRAAVPADGPTLLDLWVESWTAFLPAIDFEARRPWFSGYLIDLQREGADLLVATDEAGRALGFVTVDAVKQDMDQLVTARAAQRRGVGRLLTRAAQARSPDGLGLSVLQENAPALALYRREGFLVTGAGTSLRSGRPTFRMRWEPRADVTPRDTAVSPGL
jgi:putative acetyltransferase